MRVRSLGRILFLVLFVACAVVPTLAHGFYFDPGQTFRQVPAAATDIEFKAAIRGNNGFDPDEIQVRLFTYFPDGDWFSQYCQVSTGICYIDDQTITVSSTETDTLRIDFLRFLNPAPGVGWVRIELRSAFDPSEVQRATYTLFNGVPIPQSQLDLNCSDNTQFFAANTFSTAFLSPIKNNTATPDSAVCFIDTDMTSPWFGQYCSESSGICYTTNASIPFGPNATDNLLIDFFMFDTPGVGQLDLEVHSWKNPSFWDWCHYKVFVGNHAAGVVPSGNGAAVNSWAQPNPSRGATDLYFAIERAGEARLEIFGADGRRVRSFDRIEARPGLVNVSWDGADDAGTQVAAGAYYYRLYSPQGVGKGLVIRTR
ncbi:MAG: hypothetical protein IPK72_06065 [Candidatus Eisenbacteria bacterium]|nr:hypothetical protein [Candidatus Eisenbacteria bacterium]